MEEISNNRKKNNLRRIRKASRLARKQVAFLLGEPTTHDINRYENGVHLPRLETALKLEVIYRVPVKLMFQDLYEQYEKEIAQLRRNPDVLPEAEIFPNPAERLENEEPCFYANILRSHIPNELEIRIVEQHVSNLMRTATEYKNGRHPYSK